MSDGHPFGGSRVVANCCVGKGHGTCLECSDYCKLKERIIEEFNSLGIEDMEKITSLNNVTGSFVNLEYTFPNGQTVKFLDDNKIYLCTQVHKKNSDRCYGLAADENYFMVSEYGEYGADAKIVFLKKRN